MRNRGAGYEGMAARDCGSMRAFDRGDRKALDDFVGKRGILTGAGEIPDSISDADVCFDAHI